MKEGTRSSTAPSKSSKDRQSTKVQRDAAAAEKVEVSSDKPRDSQSLTKSSSKQSMGTSADFFTLFKDRSNGLIRG